MTKQSKGRLQKNSEKNCLNKEEKKAKKIFYEKLQVLPVSRVQILFKAGSTSTLLHVIL